MSEPRESHAEVLFPKASSGFVEMRALRAGVVVARAFVPVAECEAHYNAWRRTNESADVYIGVAPRTRKKGTRGSVAEVHVVWADLDHPDAQSVLADFELPPSLVVASGAGLAARHSLGTAVVCGMVVSTLVNLYLIPVLYVGFETLRERFTKRGEQKDEDDDEANVGTDEPSASAAE